MEFIFSFCQEISRSFILFSFVFSIFTIAYFILLGFSSLVYTFIYVCFINRQKFAPFPPKYEQKRIFIQNQTLPVFADYELLATHKTSRKIQCIGFQKSCYQMDRRTERRVGKTRFKEPPVKHGSE